MKNLGHQTQVAKACNVLLDYIGEGGSIRIVVAIADTHNITVDDLIAEALTVTFAPDIDTLLAYGSDTRFK